MPKVFLSAGHGGRDPGAVANGLKEKDINLQTLLACNEVLTRHGVTTVLSRTKDEDDPVEQEVREANASNADLAVSFHANAGGGDGFEAFIYPGSIKGEKLARLAIKYVKELGQNSRGVKTNNLMFTRSTKMTAVLFESFFLDNARDKTVGDTVAEQRAFGVAYAKAILEYFDIDYKGTESAVVQTKPPVVNTTPAAPTTPAIESKEFRVRVTIPNLNIRKGPGKNEYGTIGKFTGRGVFTIVETAQGSGSDAGWGLLKSYAKGRNGWISLDYAKKI